MTFKNDISKFLSQLEKDAKESVSSRNLKLIGNFAISLIKERTRKGFGVPKTGAREKKLKRLSPRYITARRGMKLSRFTSPSKSNLTLTGAMLASLRVISARAKLSIRATGNDRKGVSNEDKVGFQEKMGRIFLRLSADELEQVVDFYDKQILNKTLD